MKKYFIIFISSIFIILQGCSILESRTVAVDSYAAAIVPGGTYYMASDTDNQNFILQKQQLESELAVLLAQKGYSRVFTPKDAQFKISFQYHVKGPFQGSQVYPVSPNPWWGMGPYNYPDPFYYDAPWGEAVQYYIYYVQELFVSAFDQNGNAVWQIMGSMKTESNDARSNFPFILRGMAPYIDRNSGKIIYVNVPPQNN